MEGQRKLESDGGGKYNWSWSPEQGKTDGEKPYLRCQGDERTGGDGERKETIGVDFFGRRGPIGRPSPFGAIIYRNRNIVVSNHQHHMACYIYVCVSFVCVC